MDLHEYAVMNVVIAFKEQDITIIDEELMKIAHYVADDFIIHDWDFSLLPELRVDVMPGIIHVEARAYDWQFDLNGNYVGSGMFKEVTVQFVTS
ncbi:hypothetical protein WD019_07915 [Fictibacillus sp. Mic-4]|uniref:hypothetical protein n=1 Tax=Fictibacillus TaxID=1329200 RepID=UPI0004003617|nr:hypothetical protein [Fictibacillus gelatini]